MIRRVAISQKLLNPGEPVVVSTRTHPKALLFPVLIAGRARWPSASAFMTYVDNDPSRLGVWGLVAGRRSSGSSSGRS